MACPQEIREYVQWMGTLVVHLQSFEFVLRAFLYNCETGWIPQDKADFLENVTEGQEVEENAFTNYDQLRELMCKYNEEVQARDIKLTVDMGIVRVRDALAHGRIASLSPSPDAPQRLVKYARPADGIVRVTDFHILRPSWFKKQIEGVCQNIKNVQQASKLAS